MTGQTKAADFINKTPDISSRCILVLSLVVSRRFSERLWHNCFRALASSRSEVELGPYAIRSLDEANAYIYSPLRGGRYRECVCTLQRLVNFNARTVFGDVDARKLHASLTMFSEASYDEFLLETMFEVWFHGLLDTMTRIRSMQR